MIWQVEMAEEINLCLCEYPSEGKVMKSNGNGITRRCVDCANTLGKYGLTKRDIYAILEKQNNKCSICESAIDIKTARVDHCHSSNEVRELVCNACNVALGAVKDSPTIASRIIDYLVKHSPIHI